MNLGKPFIRGIIHENPTFVQLLGMCPTLAVTTSAINGIGMGLATTAVLLGSNVVISILKKAIPNKIRIPVCCRDCNIRNSSRVNDESICSGIR